MSVEISPPNQLGFPRPLTRLVTQSLKIHNPHPHPIAFKVKTTAPKQYCVRPNSGRVESGESVEVQVLLQPLATEPPPHAKCKDKFLVQSAFITPDEEMRTLGEMWSQTEKANKSAIHEQKIKCAYLAADDGSVANGIPEEEEGGHESRMMDESAIYAQASSSPIQPTSGLADRDIKGMPSESNLNQISNSNSNPNPNPVSSVPPTTVSHISSPLGGALGEPIPSLTVSDMDKAGLSGGASPTNLALEEGLSKTTSDADKLKLAMAEVDKLRAQLAEAQEPSVTGLRKRGGAAASGVAANVQAGAETAVEKAKEVVSGSHGVPLEVVVAVAVGVFVMTYLFF